MHLSLNRGVRTLHTRCTFRASAATMPKRARGNPTEAHRVPSATYDYRTDPAPYPALKTEQGVFTTPPYSAEIKPLWRFKNENAARQSAEEIWRLWEGYKRDKDFIGMDTARKFIQMGRTRSLRYALRPGGRKYAYVSAEDEGNKGESSASASSKAAQRPSHDDDDNSASDAPDDHSNGRRKIAMKRTGKVYDEEKLKGAQVFEGYLDRCWADEVYSRAWEAWKKGDRSVFSDDEASEDARESSNPPGVTAPDEDENPKLSPKKRPKRAPKRAKA